MAPEEKTGVTANLFRRNLFAGEFVPDGQRSIIL